MGSLGYRERDALKAAIGTAGPARGDADELGPLINEVARGNERALEQLYDATVGKLYALAMSILRSLEDAEEVVCATYAYAWANALNYSTARGSVLAWLLMMCRSRALDRLRKLRAAGVSVDVSTLAQLPGENDRPDDLLLLMQENSRIRVALGKLSPERRRLVALAFFAGMSHAEMAEAEGIPLGTVKSHIRRALQDLREELQ
jgi:RNA polymerase sigma-70 factor (ECF subfamily)